MAKKEVKTTKKEKNTKNKKSFFKGMKAELKKVIWPTPKQLVNSTIAVIAIVLICAIIVFVLDLGFEALNKQGVDKLKEYVSNTTSETTEETESTDETTVETTDAEATDTETTDESAETTDETATETTDATTEETNVTE